MSQPVLNIAQVRAWEDQTWASGCSQVVVIEQAGQAIAKRLLYHSHAKDAILVLAGRGHNGDDARAAAKHLPGRLVTLLEVADPAVALEPIQHWLLSHPHHRAWVVDGLFGIGLNRPLEGDWLKLVQLLNESGFPILAVDVPSGLNADTGEPLGAAVRAAVTVTFGAAKMGLVTSGAAEFTGRLEVVPDIGLIPCPFTNDLHWTLPESFSGFPPRRPVAGHKGSFGHLCIIAGSPGYHGAAVLAAQGAQRAQPGLITLIVPEGILGPVASQLRSTMVHAWQTDRWTEQGFDAILFGPGLASTALADDFKRKMGRIWRESPLPVVADASALDWLPQGPTCPKALRLITPHPGEAARMLHRTAAEIQKDRPTAVHNLSRLHGGCHVVLKGYLSLIGSSEGTVFVNPSGNPHLAQGGAGDLLAGFLAGLLAQSALQTNPMLTIRYGVWAHGQAADNLSHMRSNWNLDDLAAELGDTGENTAINL
ncbi:MAG: NAD(P)H-hydrate dehydratase [Verrucomicrobiota bacterium]